MQGRHRFRVGGGLIRTDRSHARSRAMAAFGEIRDEGLEQTREAIARFLKGRSGAGTLFSDKRDPGRGQARGRLARQRLGTMPVQRTDVEAQPTRVVFPRRTPGGSSPGCCTPTRRASSPTHRAREFRSEKAYPLTMLHRLGNLELPPKLDGSSWPPLTLHPFWRGAEILIGRKRGSPTRSRLVQVRSASLPTRNQ